MSPAFGHPMRAAWALDPNVLYLNHGTVGAPPRRSLEAQQKIRDEIERQPSDFMLRRLSSIRVGGPNDEKPRMRQAADKVAPFLGAQGDDLVFTDNITSAANAVLRSFAFAPGDEILITNEVYGAIGNTAEYVLRQVGGAVRTAELPREARDPQVPGFGMAETVHRFARDQRADADTRADGDVDNIVEALPRAPAPLTHSGGVDVGVDRHGNGESGE